jgi:hypothetical protein
MPNSDSDVFEFKAKTSIVGANEFDVLLNQHVQKEIYTKKEIIHYVKLK